jgi:Ca2+-binding EF-hand superfamily protein
MPFLSTIVSYTLFLLSLFTATPSEYDCDKDGKLSKKEAEDLALAYGEDKATADKQFQEADTNKDGFIEFEG